MIWLKLGGKAKKIVYFKMQDLVPYILMPCHLDGIWYLSFSLFTVTIDDLSR